MSLPSRLSVWSGFSSPGTAGSGICLTVTTMFIGLQIEPGQGRGAPRSDAPQVTGEILACRAPECRSGPVRCRTQVTSRRWNTASGRAAEQHARTAPSRSAPAPAATDVAVLRHRLPAVEGAGVRASGTTGSTRVDLAPQDALDRDQVPEPDAHRRGGVPPERRERAADRPRARRRAASPDRAARRQLPPEVGVGAAASAR